MSTETEKAGRPVKPLDPAVMRSGTHVITHEMARVLREQVPVIEALGVVLDGLGQGLAAQKASAALHHVQDAARFLDEAYAMTAPRPEGDPDGG
jgi:hypothetical protein